MTTETEKAGTLPERLSPSRLLDFRKCPKAFEFKSIQRLATQPTAAQMKGTLVHEVLEELFAEKKEQRNLETARMLVPGMWKKVQNDDYYKELVGTLNETEFLGEVDVLLENYFTIEQPDAFDPIGLETWVRGELADYNVVGVIDRLDRIELPDGEVRVYISDYKTGKKPKARFADEAFFAMRMYALLLEQERGDRAHELRLLYLKETGRDAVLREEVNETTLKRARSEVTELVDAIRNAHKTNTWPTKVGPLCNWCDYQSLCPEFATPKGPVRISPW